MSDPTPATRAQHKFLKAFRDSPTGPAPADWPSPAILRRWLRGPGFRHALHSLRDTLYFQTDFQLATAAAHAARELLAEALDTGDPKTLAHLLRLAHRRPRSTLTHAPDKHNEKSPTLTPQQAFARSEMERLIREGDEIINATRKG